MNVEWSKVTKAKTGRFLEISLTGSDINPFLESNNESFDHRLFNLINLNHLSIFQSNLEFVPEAIGKLKNLMIISFVNNKIQALPSSIGSLVHLKNIDLSGNQLSTLPENLFESCQNLESINFSNNKLVNLPSLKNLSKLLHLKIPYNNLTSLPESLLFCEKLMTLDASNNQLLHLPLDIGCLKSLKTLRCSKNNLVFLPKSIAACKKLAEVLLDENPFGNDRKLKKLSTQKPVNLKSLFDHAATFKDPNSEQIAKMFFGDNSVIIDESNDDNEIENTCEDPKNARKTSQSIENGGYENSSFLEIDSPKISPENYFIYVKNLPLLKKYSRPHILACVVRNLSFHEDQKIVKAFIKFQTSLHGGICNKRLDATIATHDLSKLDLPLTAQVKALSSIRIHPINREEEMTGAELAKQLKLEADLERKAKKRNTMMPCHKYLYSLANQGLSVSDCEGSVISLAPLSNCHNTRIAVTTKTMLLEVNGVNLSKCKSIMEQLIYWLMVNASLKENESLGPSVKRPLIINQIRVVEYENHNNIGAVYPSRDDLRSEKFKTQWVC